MANTARIRWKRVKERSFEDGDGDPFDGGYVTERYYIHPRNWRPKPLWPEARQRRIYQTEQRLRDFDTEPRIVLVGNDETFIAAVLRGWFP